MQRTLDNCSLIKKRIKKGIGEPKQYYNLNKCEGYTRGDSDDEPCEKCKNCRLCICNGLCS